MSSPLAVSMMMGTSDFSRMRWQTSMPSMTGSMTSSRIRSTPPFLNCSSASPPSEAVRISYPSCSNENFNPLMMAGSSSTNSNRFATSKLPSTRMPARPSFSRRARALFCLL